jgi:hypothetical protein
MPRWCYTDFYPKYKTLRWTLMYNKNGNVAFLFTFVVRIPKCKLASACAWEKLQECVRDEEKTIQLIIATMKLEYTKHSY